MIRTLIATLFAQPAIGLIDESTLFIILLFGNSMFGTYLTNLFAAFGK